jgi:hypothetical protein
MTTRGGWIAAEPENPLSHLRHSISDRLKAQGNGSGILILTRFADIKSAILAPMAG